MDNELKEAIKILKKAQNELIGKQMKHLGEITDALFVVFVQGTEEQFEKYGSGVVLTASLLYKIGRWRGCK